MSDIEHIGPVAWQLDKPGGKTVIASLRDWKGRQLFHIRDYVDSGTVATGAGVTIPLEHLEALGKALTAWAVTNVPDSPPAAS